MTIRKQPNGKWLCECYPNGREGKRVRKQFATKGEAIAFEGYTMEEVNKKPWLGEKEDKRRLSDLVAQWYALHGQTLSQPHKLMNKLKVICDAVGDPIATSFQPADFAKYREARLNGTVKDSEGCFLPAVKPRTVNLEQSNLSAVFGTLKKLGHWSGINPLAGLPTFRIAESELSFLATNEIKRLLDACNQSLNPDLIHVTKICLATGARWNEAESLQGHQISKYRITYTKTKGKKNRTVPISPTLYDQLPKNRGRLFKPCRKAFERALKRAGIELPEGQCTHVLRHSFASHFMMNGGNILVLRNILGHSDIKMTMVYAHFAPDHLEDAVTKNPLHNINF